MGAKRLAAGLLSLAAVSALLFFTRSRWRSDGRSPVPELVTLVPRNVQFLLYADLAALRTSPIFEQLVALTPPATADPDYADFVRATGFDYTRDLDRVLLALEPGSPPRGELAIADGRFDIAKIRAHAVRTGKLQKEHGTEVYVVPASTPGQSISLTFLAPSRVALAEGADAVTLLQAKRTPNGFDAELRERIARVSGASVFAIIKVGSLPEDFSVAGLRSDQLANLAGSLRWVTVAARPEGDRLRVSASGECKTRENAEQLVGTLDGLRLLAQASLADPKTRRRMQPGFADALEALLHSAKVNQENQEVRLLLEVTPEMLRAATAQRGVFRP